MSIYIRFIKKVRRKRQQNLPMVKLCGPLSNGCVCGCLKIMKKYRVYVLKLTLFSHVVHYNKTPPLFTISNATLQCVWPSDDVHLWPTSKCEKISETTIVMRFTSIYVVVHLPRLCGPLVHKKNKKNTTKTCLRKCTSDNRNHEVHLTVWCSAIFDWSSAVFYWMKFTRRFGCREKECQHFGKFETALKP